MTPPATPTSGPAPRSAGRVGAGQRFGHVCGRHHPAGEPTADPGTYLARDDETGITYWFGYTDIVTEGLRTIRIGESVRFLADQAQPGHASYVIRLDLPDVAEYYQ
jgi:hypothetical protein